MNTVRSLDLPDNPGRRLALGTLAAATGAALVLPARRASARPSLPPPAPADSGHAMLGPVEPRPAAPPLPLTLHDGQPARLEALLPGRVTAVQLMFAGCSATCPLQGAIFSAVQQRLDREGRQGVQLLSVSIDALGDDARALAAWRARFQAGPRWLAGVPPPAFADRLPSFLGGGPARRGNDRHTAQVFLFDTRGRLAYRFAELASAADLARGMADLQRLG
jgi:protein SCO1/2